MKRTWSLKAKFILISVVLTFSMIFALVIFTTYVYLNGIRSLEVETVETNIDRAKASYDYLVNSYSSKLNDWSQWDDSYQFMKDFNKPFIESNLNDATLSNLNVDEMLFFDTSGELKYSIALDKIKKEEKDFPEDVKDILRDNQKLEEELLNKGKVTGILQTEDGKLMFGAQKIVKSDGSGDPNGYLFFGRYLGNWLETDLSGLVQLPVKFDSFRQNDKPYGIAGLDVNKNEKIFGHFVEPVFNSDKTVTFEVETERNIWKVGYQGAIYQIIIISVFSIVIGILNYLFLRVVILSDIYRFRDDVVELSKNTTSRSSLSVDSNNSEIRILQESVSRLIDELNKAKSESDDKAQELNKINNLMVGRELKMTELKELINDLKKKII